MVDEHEGEYDHDPLFREWVKGLAVGIVLVIAATTLIGVGPVEAHSNIHKEVVRTQGPLGAFCPEDMRLVPVKHHGYNAESVSGWTYTCRAWDDKGKMAP